MTSILAGMLVLVGVALQAAVVDAQITLDGSLGPKMKLEGPAYKIDPSLGRVVTGQNKQGNLFFSFGEFNLLTRGSTIESATFTNPSHISNIQNILGRVTGGTPSNINGKLISEINGANLFLLNPAGMIFGPNASLDIKGSFHASTASYLRFTDGAQFFADLSKNSALTAAPPAAFGFLGASGPITIDGAKLDIPNGQLSLVGNIQPLINGKTLLVTGGDIAITGSTLTAAGGRIHLVAGGASTADLPKADTVLSAPNSLVQLGSVTSGSEVSLRPAANPTGRVDITTNATIDVSGGPGGTIIIRGGQGGVTIDGKNTLVLSSTRSGSARGGPITIWDPAGRLTVTNGGTIRTTTAGTATGSGGDLTIDVGSLDVRSGGHIGTDTLSLFGSSAGHTTINATGSITVSGPSTIISSVMSLAAPSSAPTGGVSISAASLAVENGALIETNRVTPTGIGAGVIIHDVGTLSVTGGARITTASTDTGGAVVVRDVGSVLVSGPRSGIVTTATQRAGDISLLDIGSLTLTQGAVIQAGNLVGQATKGVGNVTVSARDIVISDQAKILSSAARGDIGTVSVTAGTLTMNNGFIAANTVAAGRGGTISVAVDRLSLTHGAEIISNSAIPSAAGSAGDVAVTAHESVSISGRGTPVSVDVLGLSEGSSGLFSTTARGSRGDAGRVTVATPALTMSDGGRISVDTQGSGRAGTIDVRANTVSLAGGARIDSDTSSAGHGGNVSIAASNSITGSGPGTGISSNATASGAGGDVTIKTPQMALTDHATLSATSTGAGNAGNIGIVIGKSLRIQNSAITTSASTADGGNISITTTGSQLYLLNGKITTSVQSGFGGGGNITIGSNAHPIEFVILNGSEIRADAFGGPGGNINIFAGTFLTSNSILSASSALGVPGTIGIQAGITNVSSVVGQLPESVLQAATLLRAACATRLAGGASSSLVVSGREGLPAEPGGVLPSPLVAEGPGDSRLSLDEGPGHDDLSTRIALWVPAPRCLR